MGNEPIKDDGPGELAYGETLQLRISSVNPDGWPIVAFNVFGSYVEVKFVPVNEEDGKMGYEPMINKNRSDRSLSDEQAEYVKSIAALIAGMDNGWFPERVKKIRAE